MYSCLSFNTQNYNYQNTFVMLLSLIQTPTELKINYGYKNFRYIYTSYYFFLL